MSNRTLRVTGPGGRWLDLEISGPENGLPLIFHNGTPGAGTVFGPMVAAGTERGIRHIAYSRPGYGGSDRHAGRTVADCTADVLALADELGLESFPTAGWSGGGPHALACAALLPERTLAAASIAGVAPAGAPDLDWVAGMGEGNIDELAAARGGERPLRMFLETARAGTLAAGPAELQDELGDLLSEVDRDTVTGDFALWLTESMHTGLRESIWGWFDDDLAFLADWGFELGAIRTPVTIWQGGQDRFVPFAHGQWLAANVAGARQELLPEHGHLSLGVGAYGRILDDLLEAAGLAGRPA